MPDCLRLVWGHSVHVAKFPLLHNQGVMQDIPFLANLPKTKKKKKYGILKIFLTQHDIELEISKRYFSHIFDPN